MNFDLGTSLITILCNGALFLLLKNVLPAYFTEKGKNLATKQDIEEITEKVEAVKAEIQYRSQIRYSLKSEERSAIVDCYEKFQLWRNLLTSPSFSDISTRADVIKKTELIDTAYHQFLLAEAKVHLYIEDAEYNKSLTQTKLLTIYLHHLSIEQWSKYEYEKSIFEIKLGALSPTDYDGRGALLKDKGKALHEVAKWHSQEMLRQYTEIAKLEEVWRAGSLSKLTAIANTQ